MTSTGYQHHPQLAPVAVAVAADVFQVHRAAVDQFRSRRGCSLRHHPRRLRVVRRMPSSVIRSFEYRPAAQELLIEFVSGRRYVYSGVPEEEALALRSAFAKGVHFNRRIRDRYRAEQD